MTEVTESRHEAGFAHHSEHQFAMLLDFYGIAWQYEPDTFVLERSRRGEVVEAFSPDFYLPGYDLYIEITTLRQKLVTKKNRKVRRLLELYPDLRVKVLYQRDYQALLLKYGLEDPDRLRDGQGRDIAPGPAESLLGLGTFERPVGSRGRRAS